MSRIRNPRYAPEFLESRLSPSSFGFAPVAPVTAEVSTFGRVDVTRTSSEAPLPTDPNGDPIPPMVDDGVPGQTGPM